MADACPIRADRTNRVLARFIDLLIAAVAWKILAQSVGFLASAAYLLLADGLPPHGQSLGKRLIGLKVVLHPQAANPKRCDWRGSIVRNIPFVLMAFYSGGFLTMLIAIIGAVLLAIETYFVFTDDQGIRLGDIFANTKVLDA